MPFVYKNLGERILKGFDDAVRVHAVSQKNIEASPDAGKCSEVEYGDTRFERPSVAVLPFKNISCDSEQVYFAEGIAEDVITALSRFHDLLVIARNSRVFL